MKNKNCQFQQVDKLAEFSPLSDVYKQAKKVVDATAGKDVVLAYAPKDSDKDLNLSINTCTIIHIVYIKSSQVLLCIYLPIFQHM